MADDTDPYQKAVDQLSSFIVKDKCGAYVLDNENAKRYLKDNFVPRLKPFENTRLEPYPGPMTFIEKIFLLVLIGVVWLTITKWIVNGHIT